PGRAPDRRRLRCQGRASAGRHGHDVHGEAGDADHDLRVVDEGLPVEARHVQGVAPHAEAGQQARGRLPAGSERDRPAVLGPGRISGGAPREDRADELEGRLDGEGAGARVRPLDREVRRIAAERAVATVRHGDGPLTGPSRCAAQPRRRSSSGRSIHTSARPTSTAEPATTPAVRPTTTSNTSSATPAMTTASTTSAMRVRRSASVTTARFICRRNSDLCTLTGATTRAVASTAVATRARYTTCW